MGAIEGAYQIATGTRPVALVTVPLVTVATGMRPVALVTMLLVTIAAGTQPAALVPMPLVTRLRRVRDPWPRIWILCHTRLSLSHPYTTMPCYPCHIPTQL